MHKTTRKVYESIVRYWEKHQAGPSYQDMVDTCGLSSLSVAYYHVLLLRLKGLVPIARPGAIARTVVPDQEKLRRLVRRNGRVFGLVEEAK